MELAFTSEQGDEDKQGNVHTGLEETTKTLVDLWSWRTWNELSTDQMDSLPRTVNNISTN